MNMCRWITLFTLAAAAFAPPTIAPAQAQAQGPSGGKATRRVVLPGMGIEADIPAGNVEWEVKADGGGDLFVRTAPSTFELVVSLRPLELHNVDVAGGCGEMLDLVQDDFPDTVSSTNPAVIPPGWHPTVVLGTTRPIYITCKEFERGLLTAVANYSPDMSAEEFTTDTFALLRAIELAMPAKLGQPLTPSSVASAARPHATPPQTAPPAAANPPAAGGQLRLPLSGLLVEYPATSWSWGARTAQPDDDTYDQLYRVHPAQPVLTLLLLSSLKVPSCGRFMTAISANDGTTLVHHLRFLPAGWHPMVAEHSSPTESNAILCIEVPGGAQGVLLTYYGPLDDPALAELTPMLVNLGNALRKAASPAPKTASPLAEAPASAPPTAPTASTPQARTAELPSRPGSLWRGYPFSMSELYVTDFVGYMIDTGHEEGADYGGGVRFEYLLAGDDYEPIGFATGFRAVFGWDTAGLLLDGRVDIGPALHPVNMLTLVPFVSLGLGGQGLLQEDESRSMKLAVYGALGARARLGLLSPLGLDLMAWRTFRYDDAEFDHFEARLLFGRTSAYSLGAHYVAMPHGDMFGISFGWADAY